MGRKKKLKDVIEFEVVDLEADNDPLFPEEGVLDTEAPRIKALDGLDLWTRAFLEAELSLHAPEANAARIRVAWRITRAMAIFQGRIDATQMLDDIKLSHAREAKSLSGAARDALPINIIKHIQCDLPLLPPEPTDKLAPAWIKAMETVAYMMNCGVLHEPDPRLGSQNFWGLLHPTYYEALFPTLPHLATYERKMLYHCLKFLIRKGPLRTYEWLRHKHLLTMQECKMLMSMARVEARSIVEFEQEEERAMMTLRLQDHQERARRESNLREELQSMKQEAIVRGLTATQPEGWQDIFARTVDVVARRHDQTKQLPLQVESERKYDDDNPADEGRD